MAPAVGSKRLSRPGKPKLVKTMVLTAAYLDMIPWVVFLVVTRRDGLDALDGAAGAMGTAVLLVVLARHSGRPAPFARAGVACFFVILGGAMYAPVLGAPAGSTRATAVFLVGVVAIGSLRRRPIAEIYLADHVSPRTARSPAFRKTARVLTRGWAAAATCVTASFAMLAIGTNHLELTVWGWLVPLLITVASGAWSGERARRLLGATAAADEEGLDSVLPSRWHPSAASASPDPMASRLRTVPTAVEDAPAGAALPDEGFS